MSVANWTTSLSLSALLSPSTTVESMSPPPCQGTAHQVFFSSANISAPALFSLVFLQRGKNGNSYIHSAAFSGYLTVNSDFKAALICIFTFRVNWTLDLKDHRKHYLSTPQFLWALFSRASLRWLFWFFTQKRYFYPVTLSNNSWCISTRVNVSDFRLET